MTESSEPNSAPEMLADPFEEEPGPALVFGSVDEFVREFLVQLVSRPVGEAGRAELRWSARWWESPEALTRLEALWRSWEQLRLDPGLGMSSWFRDHLDPHLSALMSPFGPFAGASDSCRPGEPLPYEAPPEGLFVDVRE